MPDKGWKAFERRMARDMNVERIPVTGERAGADARTNLFAFQFKNRKVIPGWLFRWLAGIVQSAGRDQVGVLVLKRPRQRDRDALVILRWSDWVELHGKAEPHGEKESQDRQTQRSRRKTANGEYSWKDASVVYGQVPCVETAASGVAGDRASAQRPLGSSVRRGR